MTSKPNFKGWAAALAALVFAVAVASPALAKKHPPPPPPPPPPPEPELTVGPPVLAGYVIDTASAFETYMRTAGALTATFADGPSVSAALRTGSTAEQHQLQQGMVAYAAIVALQDPTFVETVREFAKHASTRDPMVKYLLDNPAYVRTLKGHDSAAASITAALGAQAVRLTNAAERIKQESLDIQLKASWSKKPVPDPMGRLAQIKQLSSLPVVGADDLKSQLSGAASLSSPLPAEPIPLGAAPDPAPAADQAYALAVDRGMAIAALAVLGKAGDQELSSLMPLLIDDSEGNCFNMSKLNLYQCLAVARPYYEDMYCLGLHAMGDIGRCVMKSIGMAEPLPPPPPPAPPAKASTPHHAPAHRRRH
jgi:hypothetical protein